MLNSEWGMFNNLLWTLFGIEGPWWLVKPDLAFARAPDILLYAPVLVRDNVRAGREIVVSLRGRPYVRIVPIASGDEATNRYPLRGSVLDIADDFDAPAGARSSGRSGRARRRKR